MKKIILSLLILVSYNSYAWGPVAHRASGLIAESHLTPKAQTAVRSLIGTSTLGDVANWADQMRSSGKYKQTSWYHFEKIADHVSYIDNLANMSASQRSKGGVVGAVLEANQILRSSVFEASLRADALKFLVHFIGDLHQPLHTGKPDDTGGNDVPVTWMGTPMNLHRLWDSGMLGTGHPDLMQGSDAGRTYADYLMKELAGQSFPLALDLEQWINESMTLRLAVYDPIYDTDQQRYQDLHLRDIDMRVYASGLRIAANLNSIFAGEPMPDSQIKLINRIQSLTGSLDQWIYFKP